MIAPSTSDNHRTLSVWWSSADAAHGTRIAGVPVTATSWTVLAPPRPMSTSQAWYTPAMSDS
jgi:hypothetical protein